MGGARLHGGCSLPPCFRGHFPSAGPAASRTSPRVRSRRPSPPGHRPAPRPGRRAASKRVRMCRAGARVDASLAVVMDDEESSRGQRPTAAATGRRRSRPGPGPRRRRDAQPWLVLRHWKRQRAPRRHGACSASSAAALSKRPCRTTRRPEQSSVPATPRCRSRPRAATSGRRAGAAALRGIASVQLVGVGIVALDEQRSCRSRRRTVASTRRSTSRWPSRLATLSRVGAWRGGATAPT